MKINYIDTVAIAGINPYAPVTQSKFGRQNNNNDIHYGMEFFIWLMLLIVKGSSKFIEYC